MPTTNAGLVYVVSAQNQPEVVVNGNYDLQDDLFFVRSGTLASRPAASRAGRLFVATDAGSEGLSRDNGTTWLNVTPGNGVHVNWKGGTAPTAAAGANAGTSPPAPVVIAGSNDSRGLITWGSGTGPAAGAQVVVTFNIAYGTAPYVFFTSAGGATSNLNPFVSSITTTTFTLSTSGIPAASQGNGTYSAYFLVVG